MVSSSWAIMSVRSEGDEPQVLGAECGGERVAGQVASMWYGSGSDAVMTLVRLEDLGQDALEQLAQITLPAAREHAPEWLSDLDAAREEISDGARDERRWHHRGGGSCETGCAGDGTATADQRGLSHRLSPVLLVDGGLWAVPGGLLADGRGPGGLPRRPPRGGVHHGRLRRPAAGTHQPHVLRRDVECSQPAGEDLYHHGAGHQPVREQHRGEWPVRDRSVRRGRTI